MEKNMSGEKKAVVKAVILGRTGIYGGLQRDSGFLVKVFSTGIFDAVSVRIRLLPRGTEP